MKERDCDIALFWDIVTAIKDELGQLKYQLNSLYLLFTNLTDLEVGD